MHQFTDQLKILVLSFYFYCFFTLPGLSAVLEQRELFKTQSSKASSYLVDGQLPLRLRYLSIVKNWDLNGFIVEILPVLGLKTMPSVQLLNQFILVKLHYGAYSCSDF